MEKLNLTAYGYSSNAVIEKIGENYNFLALTLWHRNN